MNIEKLMNKNSRPNNNIIKSYYSQTGTCIGFLRRNESYIGNYYTAYSQTHSTEVTGINKKVVHDSFISKLQKTLDFAKIVIHTIALALTLFLLTSCENQTSFFTNDSGKIQDSLQTSKLYEKSIKHKNHNQEGLLIVIANDLTFSGVGEPYMREGFIIDLTRSCVKNFNGSITVCYSSISDIITPFIRLDIPEQPVRNIDSSWVNETNGMLRVRKNNESMKQQEHYDLELLAWEQEYISNLEVFLSKASSSLNSDRSYNETFLSGQIERCNKLFNEPYIGPKRRCVLVLYSDLYNTKGSNVVSVPNNVEVYVIRGTSEPSNLEGLNITGEFQSLESFLAYFKNKK